MRPFRLVVGFVLAATAAAYFTALVRIVLGFAFGIDRPYLGEAWNDIASFPVVFTLLEWPLTAIVLLVSVFFANALKQAVRLDVWRWSAACALFFSIVSLGIVAAMSADPWNPTLVRVPISLFNAYAQTWSEGDPLFKLAMTIAFAVGGALAALILTVVTKQRPSTE